MKNNSAKLLTAFYYLANLGVINWYEASGFTGLFNTKDHGK